VGTRHRGWSGLIYDVAIIGAGAAGLAAAIFTKQLRPALSVVLLDGATRPGAKILVSGGSRCNVTNTVVTERDFNGGRRPSIRRILRRFPIPATIDFFASLGVRLHVEEHGKLFPDTNRARDVLDALLGEVRRLDVELRAGTRVVDIARAGDGFRIGTSRGELRARATVLATGGQSLPKSGSDGAGYEMARRLGHAIVPTTPALVPLTLADSPTAIHRELSGVSHEVELTLRIDRAIALRMRGSLLWTHFGISGPVVLDISRHWLRARLEERDVTMTANLVGGESFESIDARWMALAAERPRATVTTVLAEMLPSAVGTALTARLGIDRATVLARLRRDARRALAHALSAWPLEITGSRGYNYAEATAGGIPLDEIDSSTMASRQCAGLYLTGEVLDVDGRIGGFNFQWAWATARVAAEAIASAND
jgi:predicted Rossmann fold flavoprotein